MVWDLCAMYHVYCVGEDVSMLSSRNMVNFVINRPLIVLHHLIMVIVGFPIAVVG